jgi:dTDP-4-amino-4,6-dideoxygalactose transaminase
MLAHTLGNPYNLDVITALCKKHNLWLVEDCCDALGATYHGQMVGTFGDIGTMSFYPAHHITMGEGGAVFTNNDELKMIAESFRDWGRDCYCAPGKDNTCGKRFCWKLGDLPEGYDHKYTYSHLGYNLKITDMQAACGLAQLDKAPGFIERPRENFAYLKERLAVVRRVPDPAGGDRAFRPVVVRLPDHAQARSAPVARRPADLPGPAQDRHPPAVRRQPDAPALHGRPQLPRQRRPDQHRRRDERHLLDRRVPGAWRCRPTTAPTAAWPPRC